jgi:hypothetical protein
MQDGCWNEVRAWERSFKSSVGIRERRKAESFSVKTPRTKGAEPFLSSPKWETRELQIR